MFSNTSILSFYSDRICIANPLRIKTQCVKLIVVIHLLNLVFLSGSSQEQDFPDIVTNSGKATLRSRLVTPSFFPAKYLEEHT